MDTDADELVFPGPELTDTSLVVPASALFARGLPMTRIRDPMVVGLTPHTYLPKTLCPRLDWVASVAIPAFSRYREVYMDRCPGGRVRSFCTVGTGAGLDALGAIELLSPSAVTVTDIHRDVVAKAVANIVENLVEPAGIQVRGVDGDLATPLLHEANRYDLIYENLPNLPLASATNLFRGDNSSSFYQWSRSLGAPPLSVHNDLLDLHFAMLFQARELLCDDGRILCSIGARRPLASILSMPRHAGCVGNILAFTWKIQSDATTVVNGYAEFQQRGFGPFHFYPIDVLDTLLTPLSPADAAERAFDLESTLARSAIDAQCALDLIQNGGAVGHTVVVIAAEPLG